MEWKQHGTDKYHCYIEKHRINVWKRDGRWMLNCGGICVDECDSICHSYWMENVNSSDGAKREALIAIQILTKRKIQELSKLEESCGKEWSRRYIKRH